MHRKNKVKMAFTRFRSLLSIKYLLVVLAGLLASIATATPPERSEREHRAKPTLHFGVLAFRPKPEVLKRWQPVADYLAEKIPTHQVVLEAFDYPELEQAVRERRIDLVLTQPAQYVALSVHQNLYSPLATLVESEGGHPLNDFGGVILVKAQNENIGSISDLKHKRVAASTRESLGGYEAQALELLAAGIRPDDYELIETGQQDAALIAVLSGRADAGFVRSGLIEQMVREGKVALSDLRILKANSAPDYPLILSTRLYPQWALAAMPWLTPSVSRQIASAVLAMPQDGEVAKAAKISGFTIPGDYRSVDRLMRTLRVPPFDERVPLVVVWEDHRLLVVLTAISMSLALFWMIGLHIRNRRERARGEAALRESEQHFRTLSNSGTTLIWASGSNKLCDYFNDPWLHFTGRTMSQELGNGWTEGIHPDDIGRRMNIYQTAFDRQQPFSMEYRLRHSDGSYRWIMDNGYPRFDSSGNFIGYIGHCYDITERRLADDQLRQAASVFQNANEGITITAPDGTILDVNEAFTRITGYSRDEVIGQNPRLLSSGRQGREFYTAMWNALMSTGQWNGEIWNRRKGGEVYAEILTISTVRDESGKILHYIGLFYDITVLKEHQQHLEQIAHYDSLTRLPNRVLLADRLYQAIARASRNRLSIAIAYIDLDGFKAINDSHGHEVGDKLLVQLAGRMKEALRDIDTLSRLGGDEFVAVLHDLQNHDDSIQILERLLASAAQPVYAEGIDLRVSASIGVTYYPQAEDIDADQLLRQADQAMYQAKQAGKNQYYIFDAEHDRAIRGRRESVGRISNALENKELVLHYQPKVNMRTGQVIGVEALIRWHHPERGLLPPALFLPVIEDDNVIVDIGDWVIETALNQMEAWQAHGISLPVSVNVAGRQLQSPDFIEKLKIALSRHPSVAHQLELEVLETSALEDIAQVSHVINACQEMGVGFSLDDFGTGYSSLTYLKRLPAQSLKIDQSFVRDMLEDSNDLAILDGILGLAIAFQRQVIAEGVETAQHVEMLLRLGCELGQGYAIARPMPADSIYEWLATWHPPVAVDCFPIHREDLPILFAAVKHRSWVSMLGKYLRGEKPAPPQMDRHQCSFGKWFDKFRQTRHAAHPATDRIIQLHDAIHDQANALLELMINGRTDEANTHFAYIETLRDELLTELHKTLSPVTQKENSDLNEMARSERSLL
jgi:diguanylate cyclase (GGDEF)-like protein/PAS domain S-box-containing protein